MNRVKWGAVAGLVLHLLIAGMMIMAGLMKWLGQMPPEAVEELKATGLGDMLLLIGTGELVSAILLLIPRTLPLGALLTSGFWGGVICMHMYKGESYVPYAAFLALTWLGAYLRDPRIFAGFVSAPTLRRPEQVSAPAEV